MRKLRGEKDEEREEKVQLRKAKINSMYILYMIDICI